MALVLTGGVTYLLYNRLGQRVAHPKVIQVVASTRSLPVGVALTSNDVAVIDWPAEVPLPGSFSKVDRVLGRPLMYPLGPKEPVLDRDLAVSGSGPGLSVKIPPGMRATSVRSNEIVGVAGFLSPGSHVDVLGTLSLPGGGNIPVTQIILQDVEVLTAGERIEPDPQGKPQAVNVVTLLLTPSDSQKLLLASTQGTIQFVLRGGADQGKVDATPTRMDELITGVKTPPPLPTPVRRPQLRKAAAPPPKPPDVYVLEVIQGETRSIQKF